MWNDIVATAHDSKEIILHRSSGYLPNGHVCGILGPSGAGKSTFLSAIAGRPGASLQIDGHVLHHYESSSSMDDMAPVLSHRVAWLQQQDVFFERLTVQETLDLAVFLEWPRLSRKQRQAISSNSLESLGLSRVKDRQVGSPRMSNGANLSGGEMRRLSVALELVTDPLIFLADEATSGIDSKISETVMGAIVSLVKERQIPCFCTLHQPRSSIWKMLDYCIVMAAGGKMVYAGSREASTEYFAALGYSCPKETNPAEYFVDLVSVDTEDIVQAAKDRDRIEQLALAFQKQNKMVSSDLKSLRFATPLKSTPQRKAVAGAHSVNPILTVRRFGALVQRSFRQTIRSQGLNGFRLLASVGTALLLSQIFPSVTKGPPTSRSITDRICILSFGSINMFLIAVMKTIGIFSLEKPVVHRERSRNDYTSLEYILSKAFVETPLDMVFAACFTSTLKVVTGLSIGWKQLSGVFALMTMSGASLGFLLGSLTNNVETATAAAMPIVVILMVVGIINPSGVDPTATSPALVQLFKYYSPIASAVEALVVAEFSGMKFASTHSLFSLNKLRELPRMGGLALVQNGDEALYALGLAGVKFDSVLSHMALLSLVNFGLSWFFLSISNSSKVKRWKRKATSPFRGALRKQNRTLKSHMRNTGRNNLQTPGESQRQPSIVLPLIR